MPDRLTGRVVLTALLILLAAAGIGAAGPGITWRGESHRELVVTGLVLEVVLAGLLVALRWRRPPRREGLAGHPNDLGPRLASILSGVLITFLVLIPGAILVSLIGKLNRTQPTPPVLRQRLPRRLSPGAVTPAHPGANIGVISEYVLIALLAAAVVATAVLLLRRRTPRPAPLAVPVDEPVASAGDLARAVESGRHALGELDDARSAIIRCYVAMESSLAHAGAERGTSETPDELLARAVAGGLLDRRPAGRLTALFYEARFSTHPMPPEQRARAQDALAEIAAALAERERRLAVQAAAAAAAAGAAAAASSDQNGQVTNTERGGPRL